MKKLKVSISGMHCASCASNIERSVKSVKGVKEVRVSVMTHNAFIECEDATNEQEVKKAVAKAGYKVVTLE